MMPRLSVRPVRLTGWLYVVAALLLSGCSDGIIEPNNTHDRPGTPAGVVERDTLLVGFQNDTLAFELVGGQSGQVLHRRILDTTGEGERDKFRFILGAELDRERRVLLALIRPRQSERREMITLAEVAGNVEGPDLLVAGGKRSEEAVRLMIYEVDDLGLRDSVFVATPFGPRVNSVRLDALV